MSEEDDKRHKEFLYRHDIIIQDIRFTKTLIWNTTYLTILAISALIAAAFYIIPENGPEICAYTVGIYKFVSIISILSIGVLGLSAVIFHSRTLERNRKADKNYKTRFLDKDPILKVEDEEPVPRWVFKFFHPLILIGTLLSGILIIRIL